MFVKDYISYSEFSENIKSKYYNDYLKNIDLGALNPLLKKARMYFFMGIATVFLAIIMFLSLMFAAFSSANTQVMITLAVFTGIFIIVAIVFHALRVTTKRKIIEIAFSNVNSKHYYDKFFNELNVKYEFFDENLDELKRKTQNNMLNLVNQKDLDTHSPLMAGPEAYLIKQTEPQYLLIENKYPVSLVSTTWKEEIVTRSGREVRREVIITYNTVLKIDLAKANLNQNYKFSMFTDSGWSNTKFKKLENNEFNKMIQLHDNNEYLARKIFTPLGMENMVNFLKEKMPYERNVVYGNDREIIINSNCSRFLTPNFKYSLNIDKLLKSLFLDILQDVYLTYSTLHTIFIPLLLDTEN
ncbi:hypothetical protein ACJA23_01875 [Mycoplasma corogypsi]|uniref:hypothetical protein n=1 Tax=Mycoplasma corogypsi TaxID=2106 RepID=UPI00387341D1